MNPALWTPLRKLEVRFINLYFWMYWLQFIHGTFLNLHLKRQGLTGTEIGIAAATMAMSGVLLTPVIGVWFDRSNRRPAFLAGIALLAGCAFASYSLVSTLPAVLPLAVLLGIGWLPMIPLLDSLTFSKRVTAASRHGFGGYRRWGSVGFAVAALVVSDVATRAGLWIAFPWYLGCAAVIAVLALGIPGNVIPKGDRDVKLSALLHLLSMPGFRRFLILSFLAAAGASSCWSFRAIYLSSIGVTERGIGSLLILPILAEVLCFTAARRLMTRWGPTRLICLGLCLGAVRWACLSLVPFSPLLYLTETLHGFAFAIQYPAAVAFVQHAVPQRLRGTAQILFFTCAGGLGTSVGAFTGGMIFDAYGMAPVFRLGSAVMVAVGALFVLLVKEPAGVRR